MKTTNVLTLLILFGLAGPASAQGLVDPTRPPPGWLPNDPRTAQVARPMASGEGSVQLLLVGPTRRFAIVNGDLVGDKTTGHRIVDIKRNDLVVQSDRGRETVRLFPDVQKTEPKKRAGLGEKEQK